MTSAEVYIHIQELVHQTQGGSNILQIIKKKKKNQNKNPSVLPVLKKYKNLSQRQSETRAQRARVGVHVIWELVSILALRIASGTRNRLAARVTGDNGEARLDKLGSRVKIDGGHVPEKGVTILGVFELKDAIFALAGRHLDGDTTTVGVGGPVLAVVTSGAESLHGSSIRRGGPQVNVGIHVVDDLKTAAAGIAGLNGAGFSGSSGVGESSSGGSEKAGKEDVESHDGRL